MRWKAIACWSSLPALLLLMGCAFPGQRVLHLEVYQGEQLVLRTMFSAPDREGAADFWRRAGLEPFAVEHEGERVRADEANPLRATISGAVRIRIVHGDRLMTSASLTNLVLQREAAEGRKWHLAPEEVARARRVAGL